MVGVQIELTHIIIVALGSAVATLAGIIYVGKNLEIRRLTKERDVYRRLIWEEAARKDETLRTFAELINKQSEGGESNNEDIL